MTLFEWIITITYSSFCILFGVLAAHSIGKQQTPTYKDLMDWDFVSCKQMRESGLPEEEIADLMRRKGNYYDKDYE